MNNISAVILAAGAGTRMNTSVPKVLHKVGSRTLLGRTIFNLNEAEITDITAVVGYKAEEIKNVFRNEINFVEQEELLGSGDAVKCGIIGIEKNTGNILVTCGDTPLITAATYKRLINTHLETDASCTLLTCEADDPVSYGRIIRDKDGHVLKIVEEKDLSESERSISEINVGTYCFKINALVKFIRDIEVNEEKKEFYLTDIIEIFARNNEKTVSESCCVSEARGINSRRDLAAANKIVNENTLVRLMDSGVTITDPGTTNIDETARIGEDTTIFPHTVIEADVRVEDRCSIGPFARLRQGTRLAADVEIGNFVETCRTEIGQGTRVKHHTYLGDTVVGKKVNIGAGTITANYDGKKKHRTIIDDEAFVGAGATLIAPVCIGKGARVGAGSVVTKNKDVPAGKTVIGVPARLFEK